MVLSARHGARRFASLATLALLVAGCSSGGGPSAPATAVALTLSPDHADLALGTSRTFEARAWYDDGSTADVSAQVAWSTLDGSIAGLGPEPGRVVALSLGTTEVVATHADGPSASAPVQVTAAVLESLEVTPTSPSLALGTTLQLAATGTFSDGSIQDLTDSVSWSSSSSAVAVSTAPGSEGLCTATSVGWAMVTALDAASGIGGGTDLTVTPAELVSLDVTPSSPSLALGTSLQLTAMGTFTDATLQDLTAEVTWGSDDPGIALVSNAPGIEGLLTSVAQGSTQVTATYAANGVSGATPVDVTPAELVSLDVTPKAASIALGTGQAFSAIGAFTDGSVQDLTAGVVWSSSSLSVATIASGGASAGHATSQGVGLTSISATHAASGVDDATDLTVTAAELVSIEVAPADPSIALGTQQAFSATGTFTDASVQDLTDAVTWSSSDTGVATVSNAGGSQGLATSVSVGTTDVSAAHAASGIVGATTLEVTPAVLVSIDVTPADPTIALGTSQAFVATGTYSDATQQDLTTSVTWSSSVPAVATISNAGGSQGWATSASVGTTTITATHAASGIVGDTTLEVTPAVLVALEVAPADPSIALGTTQAFTATGTYSDSTTQNLTTSVTWSSSAAGVATISNAGGSQGTASSVAVGTTTIAATHVSSGVVGDTTLEVTPAVLVSLALTPADALLGVGDTRAYKATGTYSDATTQDLTTSVTWSSSNTAAVTVSNAGGSQGLATGIADGISTLSALHPASGVSGATAVQAVSAITLRAASSAGAASGLLSLSLGTPPGTTAGDFLLAAVAVRPHTAAVTPPAGWTLIRRVDNSSSAAHSLLVYRRVATAGEPSQHTFAFSASTGSAGGITAFVRVDPTAPIDVEAGVNTPSALSHAAPSLVSSSYGDLLVTLHAFSSTAAWTPPTGMVEAFDQGSQAGPIATGISIECAYAQHTTPGATGARTATAANDADVGNTMAIALRRAP